MPSISTNTFTDAEKAALAAVPATTDIISEAGIADSEEGILRKIADGSYAAMKTNLSASAAPGVTDDSDSNYAIGSLWVDTTADIAYVCVDITVGAAVWLDLTAGSGSSTTSGAGAPSSTPAAVGDLYIDTTADKAYIATDTSGSVDWDLIHTTLDNLTATAAPTANEDSGDGYEVGSLWIDVTGDAAYYCVDSTVAAAVWLNLTAAGSSVTSGAGAPGSTPSAVGDVYIDTTADTAYIATDTTGSGDWDLVHTNAVLDNIGASVDPTVNEDSGDGYAVGSLWINTTLDKAFYCLDSTVAAAVWLSLAAVGSVVTSGVVPPATTPAALGDVYIDTAANVSYNATGTASSADWKQATGAGGGDLLAASNLSDVASATTARINLGVEIGADVLAYQKHKFDATVAPGVSNDSTESYTVGSRWVDVTADLAYIAVDVSVGAAVWSSGGGGDLVDDITPQLGAALDAQTFSMTDIGAITQSVNTVGASGATETLDTSLYGVHQITMDQNCTFTFSNPPASGISGSFVLHLDGAFTPTFPGTVSWLGTAPTYATPLTYVFYTLDAGTTWYGNGVGDSGDLRSVNNLSDVALAATARTNLGVEIGADVLAYQKHKFDATVSPAVGNDTTEGYTVGSRWVDVTNDIAYVCIDVSSGAAIWSAGGGGVSPSQAVNGGTETIDIAGADGLAFGQVKAAIAETSTMSTSGTKFGQFVGGVADMGGTIKTLASGAMSFGSATGAAGVLTANSVGAWAGGYAYGGLIEANGSGSFAFGYTSGAGGVIEAGYGGATAFGYTSDSGKISAYGYGAFAVGYSGSSSLIQSYSKGGFVAGYAYDSGQITTTYNYGKGGFAAGYATGAAGIISSQKAGSFAFGHANAYAITSSGLGSVAMGRATAVAIVASASGSMQFGEGTNAVADTVKIGTAGLNFFGKAGAPAADSDGNLWLVGTDVFIRTGGVSVNLGISAPLAINTQTGTTYTLVLTDREKLVEMNNGAGNTLTVPPNSSVAFPIGTNIEVSQYGAGLTTVAQGAGVTIRGTLTVVAQYDVVTLIKRGTDEWYMVGGG
jgi:hypothetical protein